MTIVSTTVGKNPFRRKGIGIITAKQSKMQFLDATSKTTEWSLFVSKANHSISLIQVYAPTSNDEVVEVEWFYEDL